MGQVVDGTEETSNGGTCSCTLHDDGTEETSDEGTCSCNFIMSLCNMCDLSATVPH